MGKGAHGKAFLVKCGSDGVSCLLFNFFLELCCYQEDWYQKDEQGWVQAKAGASKGVKLA